MKPRLCVAPTLAQALAAIWWDHAAHVYETEPRSAVPAVGIHDAVLTGERWIIPPVRCHRVLVIPFPLIQAVQHGLRPETDPDPYEHWLACVLRFHRFVRLVQVHAPAFHVPYLLPWSVDLVRLFASRINPTSATARRLSDLAGAVTLAA